MTFDEFLNARWRELQHQKTLAREIWDAAQAAEREECAKECDAVGRHPPVDEWSKGYRGGGQDCAASVRSRGKK